MSEEFEEMEQIPWAALAAGAPDPRRRLAVVAAGGVALLVLAVILGGSLFRSGPPVSSGASAAADSVATTTPDRSSSTQSDRGAAELGPAARASPPVYSEADLMATAVDDEMRVATMWAERFVRDYLTVDGDGSIALDTLRQVAAELPESPAGVTSFVEWVDGYSVTAIRPARYRVEVGYRLLTGSDGSYVRQPAAALAIVVDVDVDKTATIAGFPEMVEMPRLRAADVPALTEQIPNWVMDNVSADASSFLGGYREGSHWWVVVMSEFAPGVMRPHVVGVEG